jgi:hypothetical protein
MFDADLASRRGAQPTKMPCWFSAQGGDHDAALRNRRGQFLPAFLELGDAALLNLAGDVST